MDAEILKALFENASEGIIVTNSAGLIVMVNPSIEKMFGYSKQELLEKPIEILIPARAKSKHVELRDNYIRKPKTRAMGMGMDLYASRKDQTEFPVEISISPFDANNDKFIMCFIIDISLRKENEIALANAREKLEQTTEALSKLNSELESKVKSRTKELAKAIKNLAESKSDVMKALAKERELNNLKSRFVTTASHEFRTPLGTILSSASLLARYNSEADNDKRLRHIDRIKSAVSNLTEILNDFLSLDKLEEGIIRNSPVEFEIVSGISNFIDELRGLTKEKQEIAFSTSIQSQLVVMDQHILKNICNNLISNAIKYSPEGSTISVDLKKNDQAIQIEVKDEGIGIPLEDQPHLFERFFRAHNANNIQGTGLGLNIVKKYVELMQGTITFDSIENQGTTFKITLPILSNS